MLNLALLGTGGGMPMPGRFLSSILLNYQGRKILIDCGEGTQVSMRKLKWGFKSIDIICITHIHGDHIFGLPGLLSTIGNSGRTEPITIIGPEGILDAVKGLLVPIGYLPYELYIIENPEEDLDFSIDSKGSELSGENKNMIISTIELEHSTPCIGYSFYIPRKPKFLVERAKANNVPKEIWKRLQNGEKVNYNGKNYTPDMVLGQERQGIKLSIITDTRPISTIPKFINNSNLFICEGTYGDNEDLEKAIKNKHMTFAEAAGLAKEGNVDELLITHFTPAVDHPEIYIKNATNIFPNTILGYDRLVKELSF
ncbi:MAG: ribonuclease Z [Tissierellia bacterium]|nr:ribonuclease Z [Tissierellia bacterium]